MQTLCERVGAGVVGDDTGVGSGASHEHEVQVVGQMFECLQGEQGVLAHLYGANGEYVARRKLVAVAYVGTQFVADKSLEACAAALIHHVDAVLRHAGKLHYVEFRTLAYGYEACGFTAGMAQLPLVYHHIERVVELRMPPEDDIVYGHDGRNAGLCYAHGKFAGESVEEADGIGTEVGDDAMRTPECLGEGVAGTPRIGESDIVALHYLRPEVVAALVGSVEQQACVGIAEWCEVVDEGAGVAAQSGGVADNAFGVETDCWHIGGFLGGLGERGFYY